MYFNRSCEIQQWQHIDGSWYFEVRRPPHPLSKYHFARPHILHWWLITPSSRDRLERLLGETGVSFEAGGHITFSVYIPEEDYPEDYQDDYDDERDYEAEWLAEQELKLDIRQADVDLHEQSLADADRQALKAMGADPDLYVQDGMED